jgi:hypothetical protein
LYSRSDKVLWMLGDIYEKSEHKEIASLYYGDIVKNYPLSGLAPTAKNKLVAFKVPVPQPDPKAVAWMTAEQNTPRPRESFVKKPLALVRSGPHGEMVASAKSGAPNLQPEADNTSATDILSGGGRSQLGGASGARNTAVVETVTPGGAAPTATESATPAEGSAPAATPEATTADPAASAPAQPSAASPTIEPTANASATGTGSEQPAKTDSAASGDANGADANKTDASQSGDDKKDSKKESSSKKKKGLKKVLPW